MLADQSERIFSERKAATVERLVADHGILRSDAIASVESWEAWAADMHDVRGDPDFWEQGYRYALDDFDHGQRPLLPPHLSNDERDPQP